MVEVLMNIKQTADYLQMNKMTIYRMARVGKIPAFRIGSEWRFKKELIDRWLNDQMGGEHVGPLRAVLPVKLSGKCSILVVDDEEIIRDFFVRSLKDYTVSTAVSGED